VSRCHPVRRGDDLTGDQVHAVCRSEPIIILDSSNVPAIHVLTAGRARPRVAGVVVVVFILMSGFVQMITNAVNNRFATKTLRPERP
jgi:hypothetical protein